MYIQVSNTEMVCDDGIRLEAKAKEYNIPVYLDVFQNVPHVFQAFQTPQTKEVCF